MQIYIEPERKDWEMLCARPSDENPVVRERVAKIIERVRSDGDRALKELTAEIDGITIDSPRVGKDAVAEACAAVDEKLKEAIKKAAANIRAFHEAQKPRPVELETTPGVKCWQRPIPIGSVGLYIPGGTAPLFSTVLMLAIPAAIAGCGKVILCTPAARNGKIAPVVLYAASLCGIEEIYAVGGAQAIAAMAYGTESIPKVDKIFGPGNQYVTTAKQMLGAKQVAIDMPAGPSEVMVIADSSARASFVAADLLSQAEHGRDSQAMLVSNDADFAKAVEAEVLKQMKLLGRAELAEASLEKSRFTVFRKEVDMIDFANLYAPEHLIIATKDPWSIADRITNAGSVFVGHFTPESAGDYASGTNHTLPTSSWAHSYSGVNLDSYMRKMTLQEISSAGLRSLAPVITAMAEAEGLQAHANAVKLRIEQ